MRWFLPQWFFLHDIILVEIKMSAGSEFHIRETRRAGKGSTWLLHWLNCFVFWFFSKNIRVKMESFSPWLIGRMPSHQAWELYKALMHQDKRIENPPLKAFIHRETTVRYLLTPVVGFILSSGKKKNDFMSSEETWRILRKVFGSHHPHS